MPVMRGAIGMHCSTPDVPGVVKVPLGTEFSTPLNSGVQTCVFATLFMKTVRSAPDWPISANRNCRLSSP